MKPLPPSTYTPSGRVTNPPADTLVGPGRAMYDSSVAMFGGAGGPRMPLLQAPEIAAAWGRLTAAIMEFPMPSRYRELAIAIVAVRWQSEMEWLMHAHEAVVQGVDADAIEAMRTGAVPAFPDAGDAVVYRYVTELQDKRRVGDETYAAARTLLGDPGLVALTATVGQYTNVAMTLAAHLVPIPDGAPRAFADAPR